MKKLKKKRGLKTRTKVALCAALCVVAFFGVVIFKVATRERLDFAGARGTVLALLNARETVEAVVEGEYDEETLASQMDELLAAVAKSEELMTELKASSAMKDEEVRAKVEALEQEFAKVQKVGEVFALLSDSYSEEGLDYARLKAGASGRFLELVEKLEEFQEKLKKFEEKNKDARTVDDKKLTEEYGLLMLEGETLAGEFEELSFEDLTGYTKAETLDYFTKVRELASLLSEKK